MLLVVLLSVGAVLLLVVLGLAAVVAVRALRKLVRSVWPHS